ncbi:MAG: NAD(P)/FAD-dependent oxidoreductase [Vicinamibacterales bacterium]
MEEGSQTADVAVIGGGAAGLAAAIFCGRGLAARGHRARIVVLDGARTLGAKILVSGGSRCNVTNRDVSDRDFWGGDRRLVRRVLRAFPAPRAAAFFETLGVALHEEENGKLFPDTQRSRTVLDALLQEADRVGVRLVTGTRVTAVERGFVLRLADGTCWRAPSVVLATGGRSLPKSGSDGTGYEMARALGHGHVATTPALAPLVLGGNRHAPLSGVSHEVALTLRTGGRVAVRLEGPLLWTHFGMSGPVVLNLSRHWLRAVLEGREPDVRLNSCPGRDYAQVDGWLQEEARLRPRTSIATVVGQRLPAAVARAWIQEAGLDAALPMAQLTREARRELVRVLTDLPLPVVDSRGYAVAEITAGGVPLDEIDTATMESRCCPGLYLVGEILDVDGRLGGFNFQWAWSSGFVAGEALADRLVDGARGDAEV